MLLKVGSKGDDVKKLQEKLGLAADGSFGTGTEKAVKEWQSKNGLTADGIVGEGTWSKMMGVAPVVAAVTPAPSDGSMDIAKLKGHVPDAVISQLPEVMEKFQINTPLRIAHFLSQCGHESGNFKVVNENLNYGAKGLLGLFKKYFPTEAKALEYERKPEKIANLIYGGRMGNGVEATGEGYKYRGRGYIQLTGKDNYSAFDKVVAEDIVANPDLIATKYPLLSAAWYWNSRKINAVCDQGATEEVVKKVTKLVNGGDIGLADRLKHFKEFHSLLA
jgi:putative chitinase